MKKRRKACLGEHYGHQGRCKMAESQPQALISPKTRQTRCFRFDSSRIVSGSWKDSLFEMFKNRLTECWGKKFNSNESDREMYDRRYVICIWFIIITKDNNNNINVINEHLAFTSICEYSRRRHNSQINNETFATLIQWKKIFIELCSNEANEAAEFFWYHRPIV